MYQNRSRARGRFLCVRTLSTMSMVFGLNIVATIRAIFIVLLDRSKFIGLLIDKSIAEGFDVAMLSVILPFAAVALGLVVTFAQSLLEEDSDIVGDPLQLLITLCLCGLETAGDVASDEGHGDCVGSGAVSYARYTLLCLHGDRGENGIWGEDEGTGRLASLNLVGICH